MKNLLLTTLAIFIFSAINAQIVTTEPVLPLSTEPVTVIFDATQGSAGLEGYSGDVYAHTGVLTDSSSGGSDWRYVMTSWGQNTPETKMQRIGQDLYQLEIGPSVREYYDVPMTEQILQMAFVFRSATEVGGQWLEGKTETGGDIFVDVYEPGLAVSFSLPAVKPVIAQIGNTLVVEVQANESDSVSLFVGDLLIKKEAGYYLSDTLLVDDYGKFWVKAVAEDESSMVADSFYYFVRTEVVVEERPAGVADGINYMDDNTVTLSLIAPGKEYVFVLGDFNNWELEEGHQMKLTPDGTRFWITIDGLMPGQDYVYQYFIDGELKIADPFTDQVSDPWNDKFITGETYPGLVEYPVGKTEGIAAVFRTGQEEYDWEVEDFTPPAITDLVIYELLVRDFTEEHSYEALMEKLDYLEGLGVNAIELMPVNEFEGNISWGYNPSFFFAPDKYYGPKDELKRFIDECHKRGIAVLIDMVLNHAFGQCPLVQMYFDGNGPSADNPWFNEEHNFTNPQAQWGYDFNHESPYTQQLVDSINSYWMSEYQVDGFRFDFTKGFGNNIKGSTDPWGSLYDADRIALLKRMADEIWKRNPDAIVTFEHLAENSEEKELADYGILMWGKFTDEYAEAAMGWHDSGKSNFSLIDYRKKNWDFPHLVGYMESHDEERIAFKCYKWGNSNNPDYDIKDTIVALERLPMNALFFFTVPGPKLMWQFGEMAYDYSIDYNGRTGPKPVRWDYLEDFRRKYLSDFYGALIKLRIEHPAFESDDFIMNVSTAMKRIIIQHETMDVVIVGNFNNEEGQLVPGFTGTGTWYNYFTGQPFEVTDVNAQMTLQPGEYHMFTSVQLPSPGIGTGIIDDLFRGYEKLRVYPNPASDRINISFPELTEERHLLDLVDISGRLILSEEVGSKNNEIDIDVSTLPTGAYFSVLSSGSGVVGASGIFIISR